MVPLRSKGLTVSEDGRTLTAPAEWDLTDGFVVLRGERLFLSRDTSELRSGPGELRIPSYTGRFASAEVQRGRGEIQDLRLKVWAEALPLIGVRARRVVVEDAGQLAAEGLRLDALGIPLPAIGSLKLQLRRDARGDVHPDPAALGEEVTQQRANRLFLGGGLGVNFGDRWSVEVQAAYSLLSSVSPTQAPLRLSQFTNDFGGSFYSNVRQQAMDDHVALWSRPRLAAVAFWDRNSGVSSYREGTRFDRPYGVGLEAGGAIGPTSLRVQARTERIRLAGGDEFDRKVVLGSWALANRTLRPGLRWDSRVDGSASSQRLGDVRWVRPTIGLSADLGAHLRVSTAYHYAWVAGEPLILDETVPGHQVHLRVDLFLGNLTFGLVSRYSGQMERFYRTQAYLQFPVGALLPWFRYDDRYGSIGFGFTLRTDALDAAFSDRRFRRSPSAPGGPPPSQGNPL